MCGAEVVASMFLACDFSRESTQRGSDREDWSDPLSNRTETTEQAVKGYYG